MLKLSPHFTFEELTFSQEAARRGISNAPSAAAMKNLEHLAARLELVRAEFGGVPIVISSGYRSEMVNRFVGGSRNSDHMQGRAADFTVWGVAVPDVINRIRASNIPYEQLINEFGRWVHLAIEPEGAAPARQNLVAVRRDRTVTYLPAL